MADDESPISFKVHVARLPKRGMPVMIEADESQRQALAAIHELLEVKRFRVDAMVTEWSREGVRVSGHINADIVQACVVSLEPLPAVIDEEIDALFVPARSRLARQDWLDTGEIVVSADGPDIPDTFEGEEIDVGAVAEERFALALDPYPRKADVDQASFSTGDVEEEPSPFAQLARLKRDS